MAINFESKVKKTKVFNLEIPVHYEDDYLAIVRKPAGIATNGNKFRTLENALPANLINSKIHPCLIRPQPVHRLDHGTSGLLLIAKTPQIRIALSKMLEKRVIRKKYHSVVHGEVDPPEGELLSDICQKTAHSHYRLIQKSPSRRYSLLELSSLTGRTHQLRIHCSRSGFPIVGDREYGVDYSPGKGLFLCATSLEFYHPIHNNLIQSTMDMPRKFYRLMSI